jgi:hypothetical protein
MSLLICRQNDVRAHWTSTVTALSRVLPEGSGRYAPKPASNGYEVELSLIGGASETTTRYTGGVIPIVPFLDVPPSVPVTYWLAWHERWRAPQAGPARNRSQFASSSIAIYFGMPGNKKRQVLRAEWAGAAIEKVGGKDQLLFQGSSAAHPHWHLAGVEDIIAERSATLSQFEASDTNQFGLASFSDFGEALVGGTSIETSFLGSNVEPATSEIPEAWARIHLAASARWAQEEWRGPENSNAMHAVDPASCIEIRSWIVSYVRYIQSELQSQVAHGRL